MVFHMWSVQKLCKESTVQDAVLLEATTKQRSEDRD